jgi:hypothetical protein
MRTIVYKTMLTALALCVGTGVFAQDDAIGKFFGKYVDDDRFTVVTISPRMFHLMAKVNWDTVSQDVKQTLQNIQSFRLLSTETTPRVFYKEALSLFDKSQYEELLTVRDKNEDTRFLVREAGGVIKELVMVSVDDTSFTVLNFVGIIDLDALSKFSGDLSIHGMEHLKDVHKKKTP